MIKPMLGVAIDLDNIKFPLRASAKLDGIRVIVNDGKVLSRNGKPIPNKHVQYLFSTLTGVDGELIVGDSTAKDVFQKTTSGVMSVNGQPDIYLHAFDCWISGGVLDFSQRQKNLIDILHNNPNSRVRIVKHYPVNNEHELLETETAFLKEGYEGVILRNPEAVYKFGRSTVKEGALLKLKRFNDSEAQILYVEPLYRNDNEAKTNVLGHTERSSHKENLVELDMLGSLRVFDIYSNIEFSIGSGFNEKDRITLWENKDKLKGQIVKYKYFPVGVKDKPRFPIWLGFRNEIDLDVS